VTLQQVNSSRYKGYLLEIYGVEVSPGLVSQVTEAVFADVRVW